MNNLFQPAVKEQAKLRLAIAGPSGSGKTYTALAVATAMGGKVAVLDTEHGSASKYADIFEFDVLDMEAPFHPERFVNAINMAAGAGYDVLVIDSLSHAWNGPGGVLEIVERASKKFKGNSYAGWQEGTPAHNMLIEGVVGAGLHVIGTMRSKQEYILVEDSRGRQAPQKVGMAPVQRENFEYEFDVYLDMDMENNAIVSKTRCPALTGKVLPKPGADLAQILMDWLKGAKPVAKVEKPASKPAATANGSQPTGKPAPGENNLEDVLAHYGEQDAVSLPTIAQSILDLGYAEHIKHANNIVKLHPVVQAIEKPTRATKVTGEQAAAILSWAATRKDEPVPES